MQHQKNPIKTFWSTLVMLNLNIPEYKMFHQVLCQRFIPNISHNTLTGKEELDYLLDHTAASYLLGPNAEGIALFQHGTSAAEMAAKIHNVME